MRTVGIIAAGAPGPAEIFKAGMREGGFAEGQGVRYESRVARGASERLVGFADELVQASVDLIAVIGAVTARAARQVTSDVPIVYAVVVEPIGDGLAGPSGEPLGNMTGVTTYDPAQARMHIALLRSVKPDLARVALLADRGVSDCLAEANMRAAQQAGVRPQLVHVAGSDPDFGDVFAALREEKAEALVVLEQPVNGSNAARIAELSNALRLPTVLARAQADAGGLFSYGTGLDAAAYEMARPAGRILRGERPGDIPVATFHRPELVVNIRTARSLGLTVAPDILRRAARVIE